MADFYGPDSYWTNGSLYPQINTPDFFSANPYPLHNKDPGVDLRIFPSNTAQLNFDLGNGNVSSAMPILLMLLQPNATQVDIACSYPLSGQYDRLQRYLFYGTLIAALLFRRNGVIALASIGVAMTYSSLAAIHLFVLLAWYGWKSPPGEIPGYDWNSDSSKLYGEIDFFGIFPILTATTVMLTPILTFSSTVRLHEARVIMVYWALLIFAAMIPTIYLWVSSSWSLNTFPSVAYCTGTEVGCDWWNLEYHLDIQLYERCECSDFCGLLGPKAPLRSGTSMVAFIGLSISEKALSKGANVIDKTFEFIYIIWVLALAQGALSLLSIQSSPTQVRNTIFRILNADRATIVSFFFRGERRRRILRRLHIQDATITSNTRIYRKLRRSFAKLSATAYVTITVVGAIVYPAVFFLTIVLSELVIDAFPVSEESDSVGAWSPFVGGALVIMASLVVRYHSSLVRKLSQALSWPLNFLKYGPEDRPKNKFSIHQHTDHEFVGCCPTISDHMWYSIRLRGWNTRTQFKLFCEWWRDPENVSDPTRWANLIDPDRRVVPVKPTWTQVREHRWDMEHGRPVCRCKNCRREAMDMYVEPKMEGTNGAEEPMKGLPGGGVRTDENEIHV